MSVSITLKTLPESVEDATVMSWLKKAGDPVKRDEKIAEIETDKVVLEITAEADGVLSKIAKKEGETIVPGDLLGEIDTDGSASSRTEAASGGDEDAGSEAPAATPPPVRAESSAPDEVGDFSGFSPAAKKIAKENDLEPEQVPGTGRGGRVTKQDVLKVIDEGPPPESSSPKPRPPVQHEAPDVPSSPEGRNERRVAMSRLRRRVAERLVEVQQTTAMLTTFNEVNMQSVMDLRARYKDMFTKEHGVKLGFMSFFVKAALEALKRFPAINASIDGEDIVYHEYFDIGIAMSTERGLMVPILRDVDQMNFAGVEQAILDFASRAKENQIEIEELKGGTFTITNGGIFGSMLSTPILNPPQSAILGMHKIDPRPMAEDGQVVIRPMMYLALSYDHRIVDGKEAVSFLAAIKELIEEPSRLLLNL